MLGVVQGDAIAVTHASAVESLANVRRRIYGHRLDAGALTAIVGDVAQGHYTDVHLAAFLTSSAALPLDENETVDRSDGRSSRERVCQYVSISVVAVPLKK